MLTSWIPGNCKKHANSSVYWIKFLKQVKPFKIDFKAKNWLVNLPHDPFNLCLSPLMHWVPGSSHQNRYWVTMPAKAARKQSPSFISPDLLGLHPLHWPLLQNPHSLLHNSNYKHSSSTNIKYLYDHTIQAPWGGFIWKLS